MAVYYENNSHATSVSLQGLIVGHNEQLLHYTYSESYLL